MSLPDRLVVVALTLFTATRMTWGLPNCPPGGTFYDKHTNRRECCAEICEHREVQMSEDMCRTKCPGYDSQVGAILVDEKAYEGTRSPPAMSEPYTLAIIVATVAAAVVLVAVTIGGAAFWFQRKQQAAGELGDGRVRMVDEPLLHEGLENREREPSCRTPIQVENPENI